MEKFIPRDKMGKKAKRTLNLKKRGYWGTLNPVTRKAENLKIYNRKKVKPDDGDPFYR